MGQFAEQLSIVPYSYLPAGVDVELDLQGHHVVLPGDGVLPGSRGIGNPIQAEGVVLAHFPHLLKAEDILQVQSVEGLESGGGCPGQRDAGGIPVEVAMVVPLYSALKLGVEFLQGVGGMLRDEAFLDEAEEPLDRALGLGIARLVGDDRAPQLQEGPVHLGDGLPGQGLFSVVEEAASGVADELELGVVVTIEEGEDPIAFHRLPEHQHVVVGGVGMKEVARQNSAGVVIHEQHQVDPPVALQPGPEEVSICTSSPKASLSKRRQGLRK